MESEGVYDVNDVERMDLVRLLWENARVADWVRGREYEYVFSVDGEKERLFFEIWGFRMQYFLGREMYIDLEDMGSVDASGYDRANGLGMFMKAVVQLRDLSSMVDLVESIE